MGGGCIKFYDSMEVLEPTLTAEAPLVLISSRSLGWVGAGGG